jgi:hypothetical protein
MPSPRLTAGIFARALVSELKRLGAFATLEFRVPGTHTILDIYIASPVRAFVEVVLRSSPSSDVAGLISLAQRLRQQFGDEIASILVVGGKGWSPSSTQELRDAGFSIFNLGSSEPDASSAGVCARQIRNFLARLPYRFQETERSRQQMMYSMDERPPPHSLRSEPDLSPIAESRRPGAAQASEEREPWLAERIEQRADPDLEAALSESAQTSDIFGDVLVSLKSILSPDQFEVLEHELAAFSEEYRHGHYTACALRLGRTLEHVVYALAGAWGVSINRTTLQVLSGLNNSFDQLSKALIAYASADGDEKAKQKRIVQSQIENASGKLIKLVWDLDTDLHPEVTGVPINVDSILRDVRRQFGRRTKVLRAVDAIINEEIFRKILDVRNDAAHASTNGRQRELDKEGIDVAVEYLRTALFLFSNVAFAVAEKES